MYRDNEAPQNRLIGIREAAAMLGVDMMTLRRWDKAKKLTSIRIYPKGPRRYKKEDIERLIKGK